ncbi:complement C1q-like protein 3-like protein [Dinothrombium tinctorium]|uniref:Complement C1q-like protein 3-like protein n=1 Tax=Dinothrombium tinctorium TaxID=1965070 RepID=A0A443QZM9_9ACAR|nr:complement C1q-like protein 3-like protein [Dinothrombium tinctorium]
MYILISRASLCILINILTVTDALEDPVAFHAIKGGKNDAYISFQAMVTNNKAKFNPLYGVFECEEPGLYLFIFSAMSKLESDLRISLRVNRVPVSTVFAGSKTSYNSASGSAILSLSVKDIVYLFVEKGEIYESNQVNRAYTSFSGVQLSKSKNGGFLSSLIGRDASAEFATNSSLNKSVIETDQNDRIFEHLKEMRKRLV